MPVFSRCHAAYPSHVVLLALLASAAAGACSAREPPAEGGAASAPTAVAGAPVGSGSAGAPNSGGFATAGTGIGGAALPETGATGAVGGTAAGGIAGSTSSSPSGAGGGQGGSPQPGAEPVRIAAAGDIASSLARAQQTAALVDDLIRTRGVAAVLAPGDIAYPDGSSSDFAEKFAPSWGARPELMKRLKPVPGNHEYHTSGASGYFDYFADAGVFIGERGKGYYGFALGEWYLIALNSNDNCAEEPLCEPGSAQYEWLKQELETHRGKCVLAYWHHPRFQRGKHTNDNDDVAPFWDLLYDAGADVVIHGHDHNYQQFAPMNKQGQLDWARGLRSFVSGAGGASLYTDFTDAFADAHEYSQASKNGVLEMTLAAASYEWRFVAVDGEVMASGSDQCR